MTGDCVLQLSFPPINAELDASPRWHVLVAGTGESHLTKHDKPGCWPIVSNSTIERESVLHTCVLASSVRQDERQRMLATQVRSARVFGPLPTRGR